MHVTPIASSQPRSCVRLWRSGVTARDLAIFDSHFVPRRQHEEDDGEEKVGARPTHVTPIAPPQAAPDEESRLYPVRTAAAKRIHALAGWIAPPSRNSRSCQTIAAKPIAQI